MGIRAWAVGLSLATLALAGASCTTRTEYIDCDYVIRRCRTVCDSWCDYYGCYPVCYDQCWDECGRYPAPPAQPVPPAPPPSASDGGAPPASDGGASGRGVLCSPCGSNADCQTGALCIQRGGADAGASFCSLACASSADCPDQFTCAQVGGVKQCLPLGGSCE